MVRVLIVLLVLAVLGLVIWLLCPALRSRFASVVEVQPPDQKDRVAYARWRSGPRLAAAFAEAAVGYPPDEMFLRAFKREARLELWARKGTPAFRLIKTYPITAASGHPGPKRREGDRQVPEGFYEIEHFNAHSKFHLSLGLNYPNESDQLRSDPVNPGFDIYIHGGEFSVGCIAVGDEPIEEIFVCAFDTRAHGQKRIRVHIFPAVMDSPDWPQFLSEWAVKKPELPAFWEELRPAYEDFERTRQVPEIGVEPGGRYHVEITFE